MRCDGYMERLILKKLLDWKNFPYRKPLILKGVRQVGKTWVLKEFGRRYYENTVYFNFGENEEYKQFFETTKDVNRILQNLMLASGQKILPEKTLIIFDEVQGCSKVIKEPVILERPSEIDYKFTYDAKWIRENLDYPTILNNFVYLFNYTDSHFLCSFPSIRSDIGTIESLVGTKGIKEYEIGTIFHFKEVKSSLVMRGYMYFLSQHSVHIEDVYKWFFEEYLRDEFNIEGFIFNGPKHSQSFLEKCRTLPSEMDGVFKQYSLYVRNHTIDRELLEMSSNPINFALVPSLINNKYVYSNSEAIEKEQRLMFSDQTMLGYFPNQGEEYESFFDALSAQDVNISDYPEWELGGIQWLNERNVIKIDSSGKIHMNKLRVRLLRDLYKQEVICASYYHDKTEIEKLIDSEDLRYGSTLFSIPEQHYLNYILNKSEHSNGLDLRNKYIHSTYPLGEKQQEEDYVTLLKIMAVVILKINEEFCLINSMGNG